MARSYNQAARVCAGCALVEHLALGRQVLADIYKVLQLLPALQHLVDAFHEDVLGLVKALAHLRCAEMYSRHTSSVVLR